MRKLRPDTYLINWLTSFSFQLKIQTNLIPSYLSNFFFFLSKIAIFLSF